MPRDVSGTYTLPAGNPVVTATTITVNWANTTLADISAALTASLSVDGSVTAAKLASNSVTTVKIADSNVTTAKIADGNVTLAKLASNSVDSSKIVDLTIAAGDLSANCVQTDKIQDAAVTEDKIASGAVTAVKIGSNAVTTVKILDSNVTTAKIADDAVTYAKIQDVSATDKLLGRSSSGSGVIEEITCTPFMRSLLDDPDAASAVVTLEIGSLGDNNPTFQTVTLSQGKVVFPAAQNASANANTLDDYEEGTWTPVLSFLVPGDLSVVYNGSTFGEYTKIGRMVFISFDMWATSVTYTTASNGLVITGLPFSSVVTKNAGGAMGLYEGIVTVADSVISAIVISNGIQFLYTVTTTGVSTVVSTTHVPSSAVDKRIRTAMTYHTDT